MFFMILWIVIKKLISSLNGRCIFLKDSYKRNVFYNFETKLI